MITCEKCGSTDLIYLETVYRIREIGLTENPNKIEVRVDESVDDDEVQDTKLECNKCRHRQSIPENLDIEWI